MTRQEFAAYAQKVFYYHNKVVNGVIVTASFLDDDQWSASAPLVRAENAMAAACQPLNDAVSARIGGRNLRFFEKRQLLNTVPACEAATETTAMRLSTAL